MLLVTASFIFGQKRKETGIQILSFIETSEELLKRVIQPRKVESHKGDNGVVGVVGGSRIFHGAPYFASMAALRTGADLAYLAVPKLIAVSIRSMTPNLIVFPLADSKLTTGAADALLKWLPEVDSLVIGPGFGRQPVEGAKKVVADLCLEQGIRVALDAEAQNTEIFKIIKGKSCVTTPHPGEFKRIFQKEAGNTLEEKIRNVKEKASEFGISIVLKGYETVISDGDAVFVTKVANAAMTCGGIGDVLSGVLGALLAQSSGTDIKSVEIGAAASYIVELAGLRAAKEKGFHLVAEDIVQEIPYVLKPFDRLA
jgi:ADP-dependent NAD(P)H-hydrate dehydratase